jgi:two-component system alkaline phosphatase synthesis response regulator PhoP
MPRRPNAVAISTTDCLHANGAPVHQTSEAISSRSTSETAMSVSPGPRTRVLIVEDEQDIAGLLKHTLEKMGGVEVDVVDTGDAALRMVAEREPNLILLDLNLPVLSGLEVCRILRVRPNTAHIPIIMLTARTSESDRVTGLDVGADDYIVKPFSLRELTARVRAMLRRGNVDAARKDSALIYRGTHLTADFDAVSVSVDGTQVRLTRREFELLRYLVENRNRVLSRDRLLERVWGYDRYVETRSVDVHVGRLRAKLGAAGRQIETVVGLGYRFIE